MPYTLFDRHIERMDVLLNRIIEVMATSYVEVQGIRYSLIALHIYIANSNSNTDNADNISIFLRSGNIHVFKIPRLQYLDTVGWSRHVSPHGNNTILVDPLKLRDRDNDAAFELLSEMKIVYIKQLAEIDV